MDIPKPAVEPEILEVDVDDLVSAFTAAQQEQERAARNIQELLEDIRTNGIKTPINVVWSSRLRKWVIRDGNHRYICAKILGITRVKIQINKDHSPAVMKDCPYCEWYGSQKDLDFHIEVKHRRKTK